MNVLAVVCHPDDMEYTCAGTLLRCKKRGDNVTVCNVANGNMGHAVIQPDELRELRAKEIKASCDSVGFNTVSCDVDDLLIDDYSKEQRDRLVKVIRDVKPDFIITHAPNDYMLDHIAVSKLTFAASFAASCPHYEPQLGPDTPVTPIYYIENEGLIDCEPDYFVDITDELETKLEMLKKHESQIAWVLEHDNEDMLEKVRTVSAFRGFQCGVKYAEGFRKCNVALRNTTKRLLP